MAQLLRLATAGSVDDGKSTLIGRLLYDSKGILDDQLAAIERTSWARGADRADLALLTDGLRAEREQGITIDVGHCYFATPRRRFIIADTPGHVQYTRNMFTGASTADLVLILVDARNGVVEQSRRHAVLASLLDVRQLVVCVNKMDLVGWSQDRFEELRDEFVRFARELELPDVTFVPTSALLGDNIVQAGSSMPWYAGAPLLQHLEEVPIAADRDHSAARFPVQHVLRGPGGYRGLAGTVAGGVFRPGDPVVVHPSALTSTVLAIDGPGASPATEAGAPESVTLRLADDIDAGRGDILCQPADPPLVGRYLDATVCWLADRPVLVPGSRYLLLHTTTSTRAAVVSVDHRLDVNTLRRDETAAALVLNEIGRIQLQTDQPLVFDPYRRNRVTGSFILVDEVTNNTVGAGVLHGAGRHQPDTGREVARLRRAERSSRGLTVWLTGLPAAGKSSVAAEVERRLLAAGRPAYLLDSANIRPGLNGDLGFSAADRAENVRRASEVASLFADAGVVALVALVSPYRRHREQARAAQDAAGLPFLEVFVDTPAATCAERDTTGRYAEARAGHRAGFTGVDDPYEAPRQPELVLRPADGDPAAQAELVFRLVMSVGTDSSPPPG